MEPCLTICKSQLTIMITFLLLLINRMNLPPLNLALKLARKMIDS